MSSKFTILTASWNCGRFLPDWSKSILAQSHRPIEVVHVDDASTDRTRYDILPVARAFKAGGIEFKAFRNEKRMYCGSSYAKALSEATGYFFGVLDADDMLTPDAMEHVFRLYETYSEVSWIYTQFDVCDVTMKRIRRGLSRPPNGGVNLLAMGDRGIHAYSHWRTFSNRFPKPQKLFKEGLRSAVDKFMGYRLEEFGIGLFTPHVCYKYRSGVPKSISRIERTKVDWNNVRVAARKRRKKYGLRPHSIIVHGKK